jgi:hypothetical protein
MNRRQIVAWRQTASDPDSHRAWNSATTISGGIERVIATVRLLGVVTCNGPVFVIADLAHDSLLKLSHRS